MNDITNQDINQLTPDEAAAALGFATSLQDQIMGINPQEQAQNPDQTQESAPQQGQMAQPQNTQVPELEGKFEQFKEDINKTIDDKIGQIGEMIKQALSEDEETPKE